MMAGLGGLFQAIFSQIFGGMVNSRLDTNDPHPYSPTKVLGNALGMLSVPFFFLLARRFKADRQTIAAKVEQMVAAEE